MLNWLKRTIPKPLDPGVVERSARRGSRQGSQSKAKPAAAAPNSEQQNKVNDMAKYFRYGFLAILGFNFVNTMVTDTNNPNSLINRALYPKGRGKHALKVEKWEDKLMNYQSSFDASTKGVKAAIGRQTRHQSLQVLGTHLNKLSPDQRSQLINAGKKFKEAFKANQKELKELRSLQTLAIRKAAKNGSIKLDGAEPPAENAAEEEAKPLKLVLDKNTITLSTSDIIQKLPGGPLLRETLLKLIDAQYQNELNFMAVIESVLNSRPETSNILLQNADVLTRLKNSFLDLDTGDYDLIMEKVSGLALFPGSERPKVFVLTFKGDVMASQVGHLREEITAVLKICDVSRGDRVVLQLNSGGGTVTGYGLASAQLQRLREAGLPLTVCVDEVAASGGYMMASVADRIIASPFAVVGSVGVVATIPNFSERLQREGVVVEDITAGKYKRTLTPYKKPKDEDRAKMKVDIENVLVLFKDYLKQTRPHLNVDAIATGETWQGPEALRLGLIDELRTADAYLNELHESGAEVLMVAIKAVRPRFADALEDEQHTETSMLGQVSAWAQSWLVGVLRGALDIVLRGEGQQHLGIPSLGHDEDYSEAWRLQDTNQVGKYQQTTREKIMLVQPNDRYPPMI